MTIKELKKMLNTFDEGYIVEMEIDAECGHLKCKTSIEDVQFKNGKCVLYGQTD